MKQTGDVISWLASRAIDKRRTNYRLLKKALRLQSSDAAEIVLSVNAAKIEDRYWIKPEGSELCWEDVRFKENFFDTLALRGDPDSFSRKSSRTPELTNTGSFEKCWRLVDSAWWMYKSGNQLEYFSELFICRLGEKLGLDMAHYEMDDYYIRSMDFTHGAKVNFEPISALMGENEDCRASSPPVSSASSGEIPARNLFQAFYGSSVLAEMLTRSKRRQERQRARCFAVFGPLFSPISAALTGASLRSASLCLCVSIIDKNGMKI